MKKIVILSNHHAYTYNFRKEIIQRLLGEGFEVFLVLPYGEKVELLKEMGCKFVNLPLDRRGMNPITDVKLFINYYQIIKRIKPDAVLSYTVKPNIYGGIVCRLQNIPFFPNVTGLGSAVENEGFIQKLIIKMYKIAFKKVTCIFFQNEENQQFFYKNIGLFKSRVIPGSGVNTEHFTLIPYPSDETIEFLFISRIMKEKGIEQYLEAAEYIRGKYPYTRFHVLGFCEEGEYEQKLIALEDRGIIQYHGVQDDVREFHKISHCTIHPTYYPEGMSNVLLESAASGRPIITTDRSGCREIVDEDKNGFIVKPKNSKELIKKIEEFIELPIEKKKNMGLAGRKKVEREFDRKIVVEAYMEQINNVSRRDVIGL